MVLFLWVFLDDIFDIIPVWYDCTVVVVVAWVKNNIRRSKCNEKNNKYATVYLHKGTESSILMPGTGTNNLFNFFFFFNRCNRIGMWDPPHTRCPQPHHWHSSKAIFPAACNSKWNAREMLATHRDHCSPLKKKIKKKDASWWDHQVKLSFHLNITQFSTPSH